MKKQAKEENPKEIRERVSAFLSALEESRIRLGVRSINPDEIAHARHWIERDGETSGYFQTRILHVSDLRDLLVLAELTERTMDLSRISVHDEG